MDEETGNKNSIVYVTYNVGLIYEDQSEHPKALEYLFKTLKMSEDVRNKAMIAATDNSIGEIYGVISDYSKAFEYLSKALKTDEEIGDKNGMAQDSRRIGDNYLAQGDYPKAMEYDLKALKIDEETGNKFEAAAVTNNIGDVYANQKNYIMAIEYYESSLKVSEEIGNKLLIAKNLSGIGSLYLSIIEDTTSKRMQPGNVNSSGEHITGKYKTNGSIPSGKPALLRGALDYLQRSLAVAKEINAPDQVRVCDEGLARAYKLSGDFEKAMEYADKGRAIKDSIFSKQNSDKIVRMENDRKQFADSLKAADVKKIADIKARHRRNYEFVGLGVLVLSMGFTFLLNRNNKLLGKEKKRSDDLLLNILPEEVASQLKDTGAAAAKRFDDVTVLFTDFVNFTQAGDRMSPEALLEELNTCFKKFDEITGKYSVEKIKTIGDAYLAVAGLPIADPKHAENIVKAAIDINAFMQDRVAKLGNSTFEIRIGIHSGSVVAGIVGVKKFAYDIWGDTVNTAARMEQNSEAGKINISQTTYELVKDKFICEYRGEIDAKGKGMLKMYYING